MEVEERIGFIVKELERIIEVHGKDIRQVAAERPMGINRARPAPELGDADTPDKTMGHQRAAPVGMDGLQPLDRGRERSGSVGIGVSGRTSLRLGVMALYSQDLHEDPPQDVIDSIAIGHCHLVKTEEAGLEGR